MAKIIIIGTSHISPKSVAATRSKILHEQPDCVAVELDPIRYRALLNPQHASMRSGTTAWLLHTLQSHLGRSTGVLPGSEMLTAIEAGRAVGAQVVLIDMSINMIMANMRAISLKSRLGMIARLMAGVTLGARKINLSEVPDERMVKQVLKYMSVKMPEFYKVLVSDRNAYMAGWIKDLAKKHKKIIVVVGMGHTAGLKKLLNIKAKK